MIKPPTKFEVPNFTRYGNTKGVAKRRKMGWFGVVRGHPSLLAMSPFDRAHTTSYSSLIETIRLSCTVYEIIIGFDGSKIAVFAIPLAFNASNGGVPLGRSQ